LFNNIEKRQL